MFFYLVNILEYLQECIIFICDAFHLLTRLEAVAQSATESEYDCSLSQLYGSPEFQSDSVIQTWFEQKWLPHYEAGLFIYIYLLSCIHLCVIYFAK